MGWDLEQGARVLTADLINAEHAARIKRTVFELDHGSDNTTPDVAAHRPRWQRARAG